MNAKHRKTVRCAIYARVSTDQGLEQDFNSLDAQYDSAQAFIRSQAHAGWTLTHAKYEDGGFSGGNTDRPALQRVLADVRGGKIDVIVVYKVDRLTRSLADFAKLVELFDKHSVSFVSVTQQFNTTTSMGRLTLNVLLSFAQFEREVTSERIRDKIAASKRKGLWVGGMAPLGYDTKERKITVNKAEAKTVRTIFRSYLKLGGLNPLLTDLRKQGIVTKKRFLKSGRAVGAIAFTRGPLAHLLRNRFYIGEVVFKGETLPGEQPAIIDRKLFDAVQAKLDGQLRRYKQKRTSSGAILAGRLFDDRGQRMTPTHTHKGTTKYRYYVSLPLVQGRSEEAGNISRISAPEIEALVTKSVRDWLGLSADLDDKTLVQNHITRVDLRPGRVVIELLEIKGARAKRCPQQLDVPWRKTPFTRQRDILLPETSSSHPTRPIRSENRALLIASISKGRRWLSELMTKPAITVEEIARREDCSVRKVNMTISLAFLAPDLVKAAIEGRLPYGMGVTRLCELPPEWSRQYRVLGLTAP